MSEAATADCTANASQQRLLAEMQSLIGILETTLAKLHYMIVAAATIALAVVGFTGTIISTVAFTDIYACYALYSVALGATSGFLGVFTLGAEEGALHQARHVKVQFEFGDRADIETAKLDYEKIAKGFWARWGLPLIGLCTSSSGIFAMMAFYSALKP